MPSPLPILARRSLPQMMNQMTPARSKTTIPRMMPVMILRFLLIGFLFCFLSFLSSFFCSFLESSFSLFMVWSSEALSSPVCSSKLKVWTGFKNSSVISTGFGAGFLTEVLVGLEVVFLAVLGVGFEADLGEVTLIVFLTVFGFATARLEVARVLERRGARPSIDLFLSIVYNYNIMGIKLTKKQLAVLNFLEDFTEENGYSPSYREIMSGLGLSSVSAVAEHIDNLVSKGVLRKVPGAARSLEILDYKHEETVGLFKAKLMDCSESEREILLKAADVLGLDLE